jgi:4-hydroxy-tetrahydrodipicolinate synthase
MLNLSPILNTDSYKPSHFRQYAPDARYISSYIEARKAAYPEVVAFGFQAFANTYLSRRVTLDDIAEAVELPLILDNVPGRTVADLSNDTALRLAQVPGIVGIKDATGSMERAADLLRRAPADFALYSGDDGSAMPFMLLGGHGVISVTANVAPKLMHEMCVAARAGNLQAAREINNLLLPLHSKLFVEANPIPVKWACVELGLIPTGMRLPLTPLSAGLHDTVRDALRHAKLI